MLHCSVESLENSHVGEVFDCERLCFCSCESEPDNPVRVVECGMVSTAFDEVTICVSCMFEFFSCRVDVWVGCGVVFKYPFGDVDCSFAVDISDVVYVVVYGDVEIFVFYCAVFPDREKIVGCDVRVLSDGNVHVTLPPVREGRFLWHVRLFPQVGIRLCDC